MILEIDIPADKVLRVKTAYESIFDVENLDKAVMEELIRKWIIGNVKYYEREQATLNIVTEDVI